ncbi:putative Ig domain-containing protein [Bradyrhizobium elkanii]|uniref:putative Ig domain-containing protein n=1 Tax=Bradyrhizobium elkanii TaxID=29448 RepID=UPI0018AD5DAB|nr:putative Ig domain-containing protein [Bradyrhizobium elkanii]
MLIAARRLFSWLVNGAFGNALLGREFSGCRAAACAAAAVLLISPLSVGQAFAQTGTTTAIASSVNPATYPQSEGFLATVTSTSTISEGSVTFRADGSTIASCGAQPVSNGAAICIIELAAGSHSIQALYNGSTNFAPSTSPTLTQIVNSPVTAIQSIPSETLTANMAAPSFMPVAGSGGTAPLSYSISPSLPAGLNFITSNGVITGTPTATIGPTTFTVTVTDANNQTASNTFELMVSPPVIAFSVIASKALTQNAATASFIPVTSAGGTPPLAYSISPTLPTGLNFNTSTGAISGAPSVTLATTSFSVTVTDARGSFASSSFALTVNPAVTAFQSVASKMLTQNVWTSFTPVTGGGGTSPLSYSISPSLPAGLNFDTNSGAITGAPSVAQATTSFTVTVTDAYGSTNSNSFTLKVNSAVTASQSVSSKALTQNVSTSFTPVIGGGGTTPLSYNISPSLPTGLAFNTSTGAITGTPSVTLATTSFTVTVTDNNNATATNTFILTVNGAVTATTAVASTTLTVNRPATSFTPVTGAGGTPPLTYSVSPTLPAGLSFNTTSGAITGTPTAAIAATTFTVTVTDQNSATAANTFSLAVNGAVTAATAVASTTLTVNRPATSFTPVTGGGGTVPLTFTVSPTLPAGLSFNTASGTITGTPTATIGPTMFTVTVTDTNNATATNTFILTVNAAVTATTAIAWTALTVNRLATSFTPVTGSGGAAPLTYSISPTLPTGLFMNPSNGAIIGMPVATITATTFTVTVTDNDHATATNTFSLTVNAAVTAATAVASTTLTVNRPATSFTPVIGAGGTNPLTYSVSPTLPAGLSINPNTGAITGTPTAPITATPFTVTVTDADNVSASNTFSLTVNGAVTATTAVASATLTVNRPAASFTPVTGAGGTAPLTYSVSPTLPAGLSFNTASGAITGTPTAAIGATTFTVTVTDANSAMATANFSLTVNGAVTATTAVASTALTVNRAATTFTPVTGAGGTGALTYSVSPTLPAGLSFSPASGAITGTPTATIAATTFTVTVTDANGAAATANFSLTVNGAVTATTAVASATLTANRAATSFIPVTGSGGTGALTYSVAPTLPAGLSFNPASGAITGTPTATIAATTFTVTVTDANNAAATANFSLSVNGAVTATTAVASTSMTVNRAATGFTPVTGSGGTGALTYSVAPTLPAGLSFNTASGAITGTPTATIAATTFTVTVTDANNATASANFSLSVDGTVTATTAVPSTTLIVNRPATSFTPVTGAGGSGALTYSVAPTLPAGLSFNTTSGAITGTPSVASAGATYAVTVTDANNATATAIFSLTVGVGATTAALASSQNPSSFGQAVTFTATISGVGGTPGGTVTFNDAGTAIGIATLSGGVAALTISTLKTGTHTITAVYGGNGTFAPSTSPALTQTVNIPADSVKLHALQVNVTKVVAQGSGQAISGAIDGAIADGFADGGTLLTPSATGIHFNFAADPSEESDAGMAGFGASDATANSSTHATGNDPMGRQREGRIDNAFAALDRQAANKAPPKKFREQKNWLFWIDVRGTGLDRFTSTTTAVGVTTTAAPLHGLQVNALMGLTYKAAPNFLVGVLGGYETFNYTEQDINGKLTGDGWTVGSYTGWKITPTLRYDAAVAYSAIGYDGVAGTAQGNFKGQRWLISTGLTGSYKAAGFEIEPSAKVYALWENEGAYVDSLGTQQARHDFSTGRASAGTKVTYPFAWSDTISLAPYLGIYGDYYFNQDKADALVAAGSVPLASTPLLEGKSARVTGGLGIKFASGGMLGLGAEYGGMGSGFKIWTMTAKAHVPF